MSGKWLSVLCAILLLGGLSQAQPPQVLWTQTYGGASSDGCTTVESIQNAPGGGYIIGGWTTSPPADYEDVYLLKVDDDGNIIWEQVFGGDLYDRCNSLDVTADGGIIITGYTNSTGAGGDDVYLVKTDADGNVLWERTFGGAETDQGHSVQQTDDGGFILAGFTESFGAGGYDMYLVKTDADGNVQWEQTYGGSGTDCCYSVIQTSDGGFLLGGYTTSYGAGWTDMYLVKTDADGNLEWDRTYGGESSEHCYSVKEVWWEDGYVLAGETMSYGAGVNDFYVIRTDAVGDTIWARTFGGPYNEVCLSIDVTTDGGFVAGGYTTSYGSGDNDFYFVKIDHSCDMEWDMTFGGTEFDQCYSVIQTPDDGFLLGGVTDSFGSGELDIYVVRLGPEPSEICGTVTPHFDGITVCLMDGENTLVAIDTSLTTDGAYSFPDLAPGTYTVELVEPLGFEVNQNDVEVTLVGGYTTAVDFELTSIVTFNDARTKSYWRREIFVNYYDVGTSDYGEDDLVGFFADIYDHFYCNPVNPIQVGDVTYLDGAGGPPTTIEEIMDMAIANDAAGVYEQACRQFTALLLNVVSDKLGQYFPASDDGAYVSQAIVYINDLLGSNDELARDIAQVLNEGQRVEAGVIPLSTPMVIFGDETENLQRTPMTFRFDPPAPNPFNPATRLRYTLPEAARVQLSIYDISGRLVQSFDRGWEDAGVHEITYDAANLPSGVYFARLNAGAYRQTRKLMLLK